MCRNVVFMSSEGHLSVEDIRRFPKYIVRDITLQYLAHKSMERSKPTCQSSEGEDRNEIGLCQCGQPAQHCSQSTI